MCPCWVQGPDGRFQLEKDREYQGNDNDGDDDDDNEDNDDNDDDDNDDGDDNNDDDDDPIEFPPVASTATHLIIH